MVSVRVFSAQSLVAWSSTRTVNVQSPTSVGVPVTVTAPALVEVSIAKPKRKGSGYFFCPFHHEPATLSPYVHNCASGLRKLSEADNDGPVAEGDCGGGQGCEPC